MANEIVKKAHVSLSTIQAGEVPIYEETFVTMPITANLPSVKS
ncbi:MULTISPECIES: hypothetical protein [unclassified Gilliamella]|nr:hypothetical protein [Gilliamella apicola]